MTEPDHNKKEMGRSIRFRNKAIWDALDADAVRCHRSAVKQLEAILATYYNIEDVEIDQSKFDEVRKRLGDTQEDKDDDLPIGRVKPMSGM